MVKKVRKLSSKFIVEGYKLKTTEINGKTTGEVKISGKKIGPPSKRLVFHQKGLKILSAKITYLNKKGRIEFDAARINHHRTFEEVRLHTNTPLYGGSYEIIINFIHLAAPPKNNDAMPLRRIFPSIDEADTLTNFDVI